MLSARDRNGEKTDWPSNQISGSQVWRIHSHGSSLPPLEAADHGSVLALDFVEPAADYLHLRNRLKAQHVCLETCSVRECLLSGTVKVQNLSFQKWVWVRITFDSWRSFQDVPCLYMNNVYGCPDTDTFSFSISVPKDLRPPGTVEFCLQYQAQDRTFWDNNQDANYRLRLMDPKGSLTRGLEPAAANSAAKALGDDPGAKREGLEFDPFGSPRTSTGIFPEWQSWGHVEGSTPYW